MKLFPRKDRNHHDVMERFQAHGCTVADLAPMGNGILDLLIAAPSGWTFMVEVKDGRLPPSKRKLTDDELEFWGKWNGPKFIVSDVDQVEGILAHDPFRKVRLTSAV